jgi:hypothetical protein
VEQRTIADHFWLLDEGDAAIVDWRFNGGEAKVGKRLVNERPKMLGGPAALIVYGLEPMKLGQLKLLLPPRQSRGPPLVG